MSTAPYTLGFVRQVGQALGLQVDRLLQWSAPGSPNRTVSRVVAECAGEPYVLEQVAAEQVARKRQIAQDLAALHAAGLREVIPHVRDTRGEQVVHVGETWWQAERYLPSDPLPRPGWVAEAQRGAALEAFMLHLREAAAHAALTPAEPWRLELWLPELVTRLRRHRPDLLQRVRDPLRCAQQALLGEASLPVAWAHGDLHPLNVLWRSEAVVAVIDWEFSGPKAELYDLANLLGCVGIESPAALTGGFAMAVIVRLRQADYLSAASWAALPAYVLAQRFAWLSEWLRSGDHEMVALECDYLDLLLDRRDELARVWRA